MQLAGCSTPPRKPLDERLFKSKSEQPDALVGPARPETARASSPSPRRAIQAGSTLPRPPFVLCGEKIPVCYSSASPRSLPAPRPLDSINGTASTSFGDTSFCDTYLLRLANLAAQWQVAPPRSPRVAASLAIRSIAPPPAGPARRTPPRRPPPRRPPPAVSSIQHRRVPRAARCRPARCHRAARPHGMVHLKLKVEPLDDTALSTLHWI